MAPAHHDTAPTCDTVPPGRPRPDLPGGVDEARDTAPARDPAVSGSAPWPQTTPVPDPARPVGEVRRRGLLAVGGAVAGITCLALLPAAPARAVEPEVTIEPATDLVDVVSADGTVVQVPAVLGALLAVRSAPVPASTEVQVTWDSRIYAVDPAPVLTVEDATLECAYRDGPAFSGSQASATVVLREELAQGRTYLLSLGSTRILAYPEDVVDAPVTTNVTVSLPASQEQARQEAAGAGVDASALWGASVGVGWELLTWGEGYHVWYPGSVTVRSVGPAAVPSGTLVTVQVDAGVFSGLVLGEGAAAVAGGSVGTVLSASCPITQELAEGQLLSLPVSVEARDLDGPLSSLEAAVAAISGAGAAGSQRSTGLESSSRVDDAFDEATRLRYGMG